MAKCLDGSDFSFADLKKEPTTVYLVLPVRYLKSCGNGDASQRASYQPAEA
jgi:type IV secretory pathway TraG/TraD family ATPase VirD4